MLYLIMVLDDIWEVLTFLVQPMHKTLHGYIRCLVSNRHIKLLINSTETGVLGNNNFRVFIYQKLPRNRASSTFCTYRFRIKFESRICLWNVFNDFIRSISMTVFIRGNRRCFIKWKLLKNGFRMFKRRADKRNLSESFSGGGIINYCFCMWPPMTTQRVFLCISSWLHI